MSDSQRLLLLSELARQLSKRPPYVGADMDSLGVKFKTKRGRVIGEFDLDVALDALANDVYRFEECDISDAAQVELYQM